MSANNSQNKPARLLSMIGFVVLCTLFGLGVAWMLFAFLVILAFQHDFASVAGASMPFLIGGGALGLAAGLAIAMKVTRSGPETEKRIETRYVGRGDRFRIYGGAPFALSIAVMSLVFPHLERLAGTNVAAYAALAIFMVILGISLFLSDHIPAKYIIPIGVTGWLLIVAAAIVSGVHAYVTFGHAH